jgi:hypothetical protein
MTNPPYTWFALLAGFVLYVAVGLPFHSDRPQVFGGEPGYEVVVLNQDNHEYPSAITPHHGSRPTLLPGNCLPVVDSQVARNEADRITLIRGPPAGYRTPA